jgi:hypothetical protein
MQPSKLSTKRASKLVGFFLSALALAACQAVAGIEDRTLDPDFDAPPIDPRCKDYCTTVMKSCRGTHALYTTEKTCLAVCGKFEPGDDEDTSGNTLACRMFHLEDAVLEAESCPNIGPGGNGKCGSDCEAYCELYPQVCPGEYKYASTAECKKFCETLPQKPTYDVVTDHDGDSVECRLMHTSSAILDPKTHCPHAVIPPTLPSCTGPVDASPSCEDYCNIEMVACDGDLAQYESMDQCLSTCEALEPGRNDDTVGNTVGCRRYHAYNSSVSPSGHCFHSGPTGDGHCGDRGRVADGHTGNCESYCALLPQGCQAEFDSEFGSAEKCMEACVELPEADYDSFYTVAKAAESTGLHCRILHTVQALTDATQCASAIGQDACAP